MRLLLIADGRSPITARWIESIGRLNIQLIFVSTYPCRRPETAEAFYVLPAAFARYAGSQIRKDSGASNKAGGNGTIKRFRNLFMRVRGLFGPLTLPFYRRKLRRIIRQTQPDLVHALRIPFEGMLGAGVPPNIPFAVSIWGNDLTLHAKSSPLMSWATRQTLHRADGLLSDTARDIRLARVWGLTQSKPTLEVPGNGGLDFCAVRTTAIEGKSSLYWLPTDRHIVINPRGFRPGSVRSDTFFKSIPLILSIFPDTLFLCPSMEGQPEALAWIEQLKIEKSVILLPTLKQSDLWPLFMRAEVTVSISQHDGTPNSLLEAMALGCFPIAGDIESMREWITPGRNGMLVDPNEPEQLAAAVVSTLKNPELQERAAVLNEEIIRSRVEISAVTPSIGVFYNRLLTREGSNE